MVEHEILSSGEKIKKIKMIIGANQSDLAGNKITRNLISQIENGKTKLTHKTAEIISNNINSIIKQKNIKDIFITPEYLLETKEQQIKKIAFLHCDNLKKIQLEDHKDDFLKQNIYLAIQFIRDNNADEDSQSQLYENISNIFFKIDNLTESAYYMSLSIDYAHKCKQYKRAIELMITSLREYDESATYSLQLKTLKVALDMYNIYNICNPTILKRLYFNTAWCFYHLKKFDDSIIYIDKVIKEFKLEDIEKIQVNLLKSNCLADSKNYTESEQINLNILRVALKNEWPIETSKIYNTLSTLYKFKHDVERCIKYTKESLLIKSTIPVEKYARTLYYAVENFIEFDLDIEIKKYYCEALDSLQETKNYIMYNDLINKVFNYFIKTKDYKNLEHTLDKAYRYAKINRNYHKDIVGIFFEASYLIKEIDEHKSKEFFNKGINLINLFKKK